MSMPSNTLNSVHEVKEDFSNLLQDVKTTLPSNSSIQQHLQNFWTSLNAYSSDLIEKTNYVFTNYVSTPFMDWLYPIVDTCTNPSSKNPFACPAQERVFRFSAIMENVSNSVKPVTNAIINFKEDPAARMFEAKAKIYSLIEATPPVVKVATVFCITILAIRCVYKKVFTAKQSRIQKLTVKERKVLKQTLAGRIYIIYRDALVFLIPLYDKYVVPTTTNIAQKISSFRI